MKVKNLFLSMFAIAALASCSQNEDTPNSPVIGGEEAKVTLKLKGDGAATRVTGELPNDAEEKAISNLSVFIFNKATEGLVTSKHFVSGDIQEGKVTVSTKTDGDKVVVIANAADDQPAFEALFGSVSSLATLRAVKMDLLNGGGTPDARTIKQTSGKVLQNGWADITYGTSGDPNVGDATVQMRFVGARIAVSSIAWNGDKSGEFEINPEVFEKAEGGKNFTIKAIYLMNASASTRLIPTLVGTTDASPANPNEGVNTVNNDYVVLDDRKFGCFEDINVAPWNKNTSLGGDHILSNDLGVAYSALTVPPYTAGLSNAGEIAKPAWWYVFGNTVSTNNRPTVLAVKVGWLKGKKDETYPGSNDKLTENKYEDRYFTVYLDGVDKPQVESGKSYNISLKLNGNFLPASGDTGGTGGGGTIDPGTPSADASVEVTVETATWRTVTLDKEWNN